MDKTQLITLVLGSAAVGALVSAGLTAFTQWRERVARQRELLLSKSIDMAQKTTDLMFKLGQEVGGGGLYPEIVTARWYHRQLTLLFKTGKIAADLETEFCDYITGSHAEIQSRPPKK